MLLTQLTHAQYTGGIGRGTVQSGCDPTDCLGQVGGTALPGAPCDDGQVCTINDLYSVNCECLGAFQDTDGDDVCDAEDPCPALAYLENGETCDDGDDCTEFDVVSSCICAGVAQDTDGDGVCDGNDPCPILADAVPGATCDDGTDCTTGDVYTTNCECLGTQVDADSVDIFGNWLLADGLVYTFTTTQVPGADYDWGIEPNPDAWTLVEQGATATVLAPPINDDATLFVSVTMGGACQRYGRKDLFIMDVGTQEPLATHTDISVRPNPNEGSFELVIDRPVNGLVRYNVEDAFGRSVIASAVTASARTPINLASASPGVYLLRVTHDCRTDMVRLVVR